LIEKSSILLEEKRLIKLEIISEYLLILLKLERKKFFSDLEIEERLKDRSSFDIHERDFEYQKQIEVLEKIVDIFVKNEE
jgi:hypothetical protein